MKKNKILLHLVILGVLVFLPGTVLIKDIPVSLAEPENCHLFDQLQDFNSGSEYAPPFDLFSPREPLLMKAVCDNSEITVSYDGNNHQRLYKKGFLYEQNTWKPIRFSGLTEEEFLVGPAQTVLQRKDNETLFVIFYNCAADQGSWKCGCQTKDCPQQFWNVQAIKPPRPVAQNFYHQAEDFLTQVHLPDGFFIHYYARNVENARSLALGEQGTVFVGSRTAGRVYALTDENGDMRADKTYEIARGLNEPNGVAFANGSLYVAEISRILRFDNIENTLANPPEPIVVFDSLPGDRSHGWKYLAIGPDTKLYFGIGAPCNVCEKNDPRYASLSRINLDGSGFETIASGVRNTIGFDWNPQDGVLYFTDNGRDMIGDDNPPDELNRISKEGLHFGFPYCHGGKVSDPEFGGADICARYIPPVQELGPHVAALGMKFYEGDMFPEAYRESIFIAEHGSWNRSKKIGYRITQVNLEDDAVEKYQPFTEGWLQGENAWGRPVDILELPDGSMLVSDDFNDAVYRIGYLKE